MLTLRGSSAPRRGEALKELNAIPDGALLIRDGVVVEVGLTRRLENLAAARNAVEINAAGRVVMPGFVDCHTHLVFPPAGAGSDERQATRILRTSSGHRLEGKARSHLEAMARHGTTTVEVKTGCGEDETAETKVLRVLGAVRSEPLDLIPTFLCRIASEAGAQWVLDTMLPKIGRRNAARFADLRWNAEPRLRSFFPRYLETACGMGMGRKIHADHAAPAEAIELGLRYGAASIDHLEHATEEEASRLAQSGVMVTLLPCASLVGDGRQAPARALIDGGAPVALGTNFNANKTPTLNMQTVVALACLQLKMTIDEAISAATINAAHAVGCAAKAGSLEAHKPADLVLLNVSDYRDLAHNVGTNLVHLTIKRGRVIYQEGRVAPRAVEASS